MLDSVIDAVTRTLSQGGLDAVRQFPDSGAALSGKVCVSVGAENCKSIGTGFGDYLGIKTDENGSSVELYGKKLDITLRAEVFSPFELAEAAKKCTVCADSVASLMSSLPSGISVLSVSTGSVSADEELEVYRCTVTAKCIAFFTAESGGDEAEFLDFILKGAVEGDDK